MDCELLQQIQRYCDPALTATGPADLAFDAIAEVGSDGHFFGAAHTRERYANRLLPALPEADWRNYEAWAKDGGAWTPARAHALFPPHRGELRAAADGRGDTRGTRRVRGSPQAGGRRPDRLLMKAAAGRASRRRGPACGMPRPVRRPPGNRENWRC